jgi:hypothetical protein
MTRHQRWCDHDDDREELTGRCASEPRSAGPLTTWLTETERDVMAGLSVEDGARLTLDELAAFREHVGEMLAAAGHPAAPPPQRTSTEREQPDTAGSGAPHVPPQPREP